MAEMAAVKDPTPDPKLGKPRPKSDVGFPYYSLEKSIEVARLVHERAGGRCGRAQLAPVLGYSGVKNGGFLTRISAAKMFGLIDEFNESVTLTDRAKKILAPVRPSDAEQAKVEAFLDVELFRRVYDDFEGHTLPAEVGLRNLFENQYKIVPKQVANALRNMLESADTAGMFKLAGNRSKMIIPLMQASGQTESSRAEEQPSQAQQDEAEAPPRRTGGGNGEMPPGRLRFEVPIPGKPSALVMVPDDLDADDWSMLSQMMTIYIERWKSFKKPREAP